MRPIKCTVLSVAVCLALGAACIFAAYRWYDSFTRSELFLQLVFLDENDERRLAARFTNTGTRELKLDVSGMYFFLMPLPTAKGKYLLCIKSRTPAAWDAGQALVPLAPQESMDVGNFLPTLESLPSGRIAVSAMYEAPAHAQAESVWHGTIRSFPITMTVVEEE